MKKLQSAAAVLMVRPRSFGFDTQTAATNSFQKQLNISPSIIQKRADQEFKAMVKGLRAHDIEVMVIDDPDDHISKPNAVFPNNWLSTWPDGEVFLYPMATESRRVERSCPALDDLAHSFDITHVMDLTEAEEQQEFLESTGVMIFDHLHHLVYSCISARCDDGLFRNHAHILGYKPILFHAYTQAGMKIYHTNIAMGIQSTTAVICADVITDTDERAIVLDSLKRTGHKVVIISRRQMESYCANVLELRNTKGELFLAMSQAAFDAFSPEQRDILSQDKKLLPFNIDMIEAVGGGSVRCMLAEVFLPKKTGRGKHQTVDAERNAGLAVSRR